MPDWGRRHQSSLTHGGAQSVLSREPGGVPRAHPCLQPATPNAVKGKGVAARNPCVRKQSVPNPFGVYQDCTWKRLYLGLAGDRFFVRHQMMREVGV